MPMNPKPGESREDFLGRCIPDMIGSGDDKRPRDQAVAICNDIWRNSKKQLEPDPDESETDFMDRCTSELEADGMDSSDAAEFCEMAWENRRLQAGEIVHKTHAATDGSEYILSDESIDRVGDIIMADGWDLSAYRQNPVALFAHDSRSPPIGLWKNLRIEGKALRGHLELAPAGTSARIDEIRALVEAGILKAVSVGFRPIKHEPINKDDPWGGSRFIKQELVETSLVSVPANPNALAVAKSLGISADTMKLVFAAGQGKRHEHHVTRGANGGQATNPSNARDKTMSLSTRIKESDGRIAVLSEALGQHLDALDNDNVSDEQMKKTDELNGKIAKEKRLREQLVESERQLGIVTIKENDDTLEVRTPTRRIDPMASTAITRVYPEVKKQQPGDLIWKSLVVLCKLQADKYRKSTALEVLRDTVGENEQVRAVFDAMIGKAATVPALTTTTGWAAELVRTEYAAFMDTLKPASVFPGLAARGLEFTFGTNGIISIPMRSATPTIAGSFVGEGAPIPVRQGAFTSQQLMPKKVAVISTFSREIAEHSDPQIEGLIRSAIVDDTAIAVDSVLLDANPATAIRPAGLRNGVSTLTPTTGGGFAAVVGDVKQLINALIVSTLGNLRNLVWLMPPNLRLALMLTPAPNGDLVFRSEVEGGSFMGIPIVSSSSVTTDTLYLIDAADFVTVSGTMRFDVSDAATVHMEDTTPLAISTPGTPATVAAPVRSFWQTDTLGIRMIMQLNWLMRRTGMVTYVTTPSWK